MRGALIAAERQHRLGCALDVDAGPPFCVMMQHGHVAMGGVERNGIGAGPLAEGLGPLARDLAGERHQRALHRVPLDPPARFYGHAASRRCKARRRARIPSEPHVRRGARRSCASAPRPPAHSRFRRRSRHCPAAASDAAIISFRVRVPVLSEQITETEPRVSMAGSRRTMAFAPRHRLDAHGQRDRQHRREAFGIAATERPTTAMNRSAKGMRPTK